MVNIDLDGNVLLSADLKSMLLAQKIADALKSKQMSRGAFASMMNVQPSIITRWLSGNHNFTIETLFLIEDRLGIKLIAIDPPELKSIVYNMRINSGHAVFNENKYFPGFTSNNLQEEQIEKSWNNSDELSHYLTELKKNI